MNTYPVTLLRPFGGNINLVKCREANLGSNALLVLEKPHRLITANQSPCSRLLNFDYLLTDVTNVDSAFLSHFFSLHSFSAIAIARGICFMGFC